jgi:carbon monoxide dehydrogenase subunit G
MIESEAQVMRIEGTQIVLAPIEQVFETFINPDAVRGSIPGCERLMQFGPAEPDGALHWEARGHLGPGAAVYTATMVLTPVRAPARLEIDLRGQGPHGPATARGSLDFVAQDDHTVVAYVWNLRANDLPAGQRQQLETSAGAQFVQTVCEGLASAIPGNATGRATLEEALPVLRAATARGKIVLLPVEDNASATTHLRTLILRAGLVGAGLVVGLAAIALAATIMRRWGARTLGQPPSSSHDEQLTSS